MTSATEAVKQARAHLCERIDDVAASLPHLKTGQLANHIDDIRSMARQHGLLPLEALARGLERALAESDGGVAIAPYLESMRDAAGCERVDAAAAQSYLAAVSLRLYG